MASGSNWPSRTGEYLAPDHLLVGEVVAVDYDVVERGLLALRDAEFDVHGVVLDIGLHRGHVEEEVAVVPVELGDVVFVLLPAAVEPVLHGHDVIDVALADGEHRIERVGGIHGIAGPVYVAEIVAVALVEDQVDSEAVGLDIIYGIAHETGVTEALLVERAYHVLLVVEVFLFIELLAAEEVVDFVGLGFLHRAGKLEVLDVLVAYEVDVLDLYLLPLVDVEVHAYRVAYDGVLLGLRCDLAEQEALLGEIALYYVGGCLLHIFGEFAAGAQVHPLLDVLPLARRDSGEAPSGNPRTLLYPYAEPC